MNRLSFKTTGVKLLIIAVLLTCFGPVVEAGTTGKITGQVTDAEGDPLPGAPAMIEGTKRGTETDEEGVYRLLSVEPGQHTLVM